MADVKPANIMLLRDGSIKDFGIARVAIGRHFAAHPPISRARPRSYRFAP